MSKIAFALLVLPYSTSPVETTFSAFKAFKTCYTNRINVSNLEASILGQQEFVLGNMEIQPKMVEKVLKHVGKKKSEIATNAKINNNSGQGSKTEVTVSENKISVDNSSQALKEVEATNRLQRTSSDTDGSFLFNTDFPAGFLKQMEPFIIMMFQNWTKVQQKL